MHSSSFSLLLQITIELLLLHVPPPNWYESLIACISVAASCISVLSLGCFLEQDIPRAITCPKQFSILFLVLLSQVSVCSHIVVSAISQILSGRVSSEYLCRSNEPVNISSIGLLPVNISSSNIPRL